MDLRKSTRAGVLFWTPAPVRSSPPSSEISEDGWDHEEQEQQTDKDDDFASQMDENGIIGLSEALEDLELGETSGNADAKNNSIVNAESFTLEEEDNAERDQELLTNLSHNMMGYFTEELGTDFLPERKNYLNIKQQRQDVEEEEKSHRKKKKEEHGVINSSVESHIFNTSSTPSCTSHHENFRITNHHCLAPQPASSFTTPSLPHLLHFTAEEMAAAPGIEAETLPDMSSTESLPGSHCSPKSPMTTPRYSERKPKPSPQPETLFSEDALPDDHSRQPYRPLRGSVNSDKHHGIPDLSPSKPWQQSPEAANSRTRGPNTDKMMYLKFKHQTTSPDRHLRTPRAKSAKVDKSSKGPVSYRTPDFSKVEPRVRFPKGGYEPLKSRRSSMSEPLLPQPSLGFKSSADIVKKVPLDITDGSPAPSDSHSRPTTSPSFIVLQEFRCQPVDAILFEQLQKSHEILLTKHAEAENTIDRLRLEAKVNLYSDPPKPGHLVQSGLKQCSSKVQTLDFPQAQRAEISPGSLHPNSHGPYQKSPPESSSSQRPPVGEQLAKILYSQADQFLQQLQTFNHVLKRQQLKPGEEIRSVSQLAEGLNSLERGYLLARDEHKLLKQQGAHMGQFDPQRELEELIFKCGLYMEELKEQVEQMQQEEPICEAPPSPQYHPNPSSVHCEEEETHTQSLTSLVDPGEAASQVHLASKESEESEDEALQSLYLKPVSKQKCEEEGFSRVTDHYQSFEDQRQKDAVRTDMKPVEWEKNKLDQLTRNLEVLQSLPQRSSDHQESYPAHRSKQQTSSCNPPTGRGYFQSNIVPAPSPSSRRSIGAGKSHSSSLSSLGEIAASERRSSKLKSGIIRVLSQDGLISPEMDSGFVGSESCRLTPAAASSPLHQRASERGSAPCQEIAVKPQPGSAAAPASEPSPSQREVCRLSPDGSRRGRHVQRRRLFSCSSQPQICQQGGTEGWSSQSDSTKDGLSDHYTESINSLHSSTSSPSSAACCDYSDSLRALAADQLANHNAATEIKAKMNRLKKRLESCLRNQEPMNAVTAAPSTPSAPPAPSAQINICTPGFSIAERWKHVSRGGRDTQAADVVEASTSGQTTSKRLSSSHTPKRNPEVLTDSEPSTPPPPPLVSRSTQTLPAAPESRPSHISTVYSRKYPRQQPRVSEPPDETDSRRPKAPLCQQFLSSHHRKPEAEKTVAGNGREQSHSSHCHHCHLCRRSDSTRTTESACRRTPDSTKHTSCKKAPIPPGSMRSKHFTTASPGTTLHCMPVLPGPLLLYSLPLYMSPNDRSSKSSGVRGHREARVTTRRSLSAERQPCVDKSLSRAIRAARQMKHTSGHMARSLATGLHYQELLTQSCSY